MFRSSFVDHENERIDGSGGHEKQWREVDGYAKETKTVEKCRPQSLSKLEGDKSVHFETMVFAGVDRMSSGYADYPSYLPDLSPLRVFN